MKTINPNDLGKKYLVEQCKNVRIETVVKKAKKELILSLINGVIEIDGFNVNLISKPLHHGGLRLWFLCPTCSLPVGVIYRHPLEETIGCRTCLNLDYRCRRNKGMVEYEVH